MGERLKMHKAPKSWIKKTAKTLRKAYKRMGKHVSIRSSETIARDTWKHGMKTKCRIKVIKKYGKNR